MKMRLGQDARWSFPAVYYGGVQDDTATSNQASTGSATGVLLSAFFAGKGVDDQLTRYTTLAEFEADYGTPNTNRYGIMHQHIYTWLQRGGEAIVCSLKPEDAAAANAVIKTEISEGEGVLAYLTAGGDVVFSEAEAGDGYKEIKVTKLTHLTGTKSFEDIQSLAELNLEVSGIAKYTIEQGDPAVIPLDGILYAGRTNYGNNIKITLTSTDSNVGLYKTPLKEMSVYDSFENDNIHTGYDVSSQEDALIQDAIKSEVSDVINDFVDELNADIYESSRNEADDIYEANLTTMKGEIQAIIDAGTIDTVPITDDGKATLAGLIADIQTILDEFEAGLDLAFINRLPVFGGESGYDVYNRLFTFNNLDTIDLKHGNDGSLQGLRKFDWDYEVDVDLPEGGTAKEKVLQTLLCNFYDGIISQDIYDPTINDADNIIDVGFPLTVKNSCSGFTKGYRPEIAFVTSAPVSVDTPEKEVAWIESWNPNNPSMLKVDNSADYADPVTQKVKRYPMSFFLSEIILNYWANGFDKPISGKTVSGYVPGSVLPNYNNASDRDLNFIAESNVNYVSALDQYEYQLDGQIMNNTDIDLGHSKEFHNFGITSRIAKRFFVSLHKKKHRLNKTGEIDKIRQELQDEASVYSGKVSGINTNLFFAKPYDKIKGIATFEITLYTWNTVKGYVFRQIVKAGEGGAE